MLPRVRSVFDGPLRGVTSTGRSGDSSPSELSFEAKSLQNSLQFEIDRLESKEMLLARVRAYTYRSEYVDDMLIETLNDIEILKLQRYRLWNRLKAQLTAEQIPTVRAEMGIAELTAQQAADLEDSVGFINTFRRR